MATAPEEMQDLSRVIGALLVNFGTVKDKEAMLLAGQYRITAKDVRQLMHDWIFDLSQGHYANLNRKPVVFDPVGVGATAFRKATANGISILIRPSVLSAERLYNVRQSC
jgi:thiamine-phosphate diphosphorylase/hydroxyethylthiazole kinase